MRFLTVCVLSWILLSTTTPAKEEDGLSLFLVGTYDLIGRLPDSDQTFSGVISLETTATGFLLTRKVADSSITGTASIENALAGEAKVLRMRFEEQGKAYESTCLIDSDLDNYARLTCQRYLQDGSTQKAGLEALFIQPHSN